MTTAPFALPVFSSKNLRAWPKHPEGGAAGYQLAAAALRARYDTDAHTAAYSAPSVLRRLDKNAPGQPVDGAPLVVSVAFLFIDVDGPNHKADPAWREGEAAKITRALAEMPGGFCFHSRGGYKLAWRLARPFPITGPDDAARWRLHYWRALLSLSRRFAIEGDPACSDWTHLYRLPHATRPRRIETEDGEGAEVPGDAPEELPTEGDPELAPALAFEPDPAALALDLAEARRLAALYPATKDDAGKTTIAGPWGAAVKALAREAGEGEPEDDAASLPLQDAPPAAGPGAAPPPRSSSARPAPSSSPATPRSRRPDIEERERLWAEKALDHMADDLARTTRGGRNNIARNAALILGHYAPHLLSPAAIERALMAACGRNGLVRDDGRDAALVTIKNAIVDGMRTPKRPPPFSDDDGRPAWRAQQHRPGRPTDHSTTDEGASMPDPTDTDHEEQTAPAAPARPSWPSPGALARRMEGAPAKLCTGVPHIDEGWRGGAPSGLLWVVGGAPGAGKTTWVTNLAHEWAKHDVPVAFIAGDEPREGVLTRLGQRIGIDRKSMEEGAPVALDDLAQHLDTLPLLVLDPDDDDGVNVETVSEEMRLRWPEGPAVLVVDSLQAMARRIPDEIADSPRAKVDAFMKSCKAAAKRRQLVVILLSELARGAYRGGNDQTNDLAATKESGAIEYEAGALCVLRSVEGEPGLVSVSWAKSRPGRVEPFALRIDHRTATVSAVEPPQDKKKNDKSAEANHDELLKLIIDLVKRTPGIAGLDPIRARLGRRRDEVRAALHELLETGVIENRGGPHRPRLCWAGEATGEGGGYDNPPNQPQPAPNPPGAGSGDGKPDASRSNPAPKGADWAGRVSPGAPKTTQTAQSSGAGFEPPSGSPSGFAQNAPSDPAEGAAPPGTRNEADDPAPGRGPVPSEPPWAPPVSGVQGPPGLASAPRSEPPANDAPPVDLAAGDDEGWEPLE